MKNEKIERRHVENLENVKQKALEMCSPRPPQSWVALADFSQIPSDIDYFKMNKNKYCRFCKLKVAFITNILNKFYFLDY